MKVRGLSVFPLEFSSYYKQQKRGIQTSLEKEKVGKWFNCVMRSWNKRNSF